MVLIRFQDRETELAALGFLVTEGVPLKTWKNGETAVPEGAVELLTREGIVFEVIGEAGYGRVSPIRDTAAPAL